MTKQETITTLACYGIKAALAVATQKNGGNIEIANGRVLSLDTFTEFLMDKNEITADIAAALSDFLTAKEPHAFEIRKFAAAKKRAEKDRTLAEIRSAMGL